MTTPEPPRGYPYQPPGYAPGPPGWPPAPPPRRRRNPWPWLAPLLVVIVAAGITVPILLTRSDSDTKGSPDPAGSTASSPDFSSGSPGSSGAPSGGSGWQVPYDRRLGSYVLNSYVESGQLIIAASDAVAAYDLDTGRAKWRVKPPTASGYPGTGPSELCGASSTVQNGRLAITFGRNGNCALVGALDVSTGAVAWTTQIVPPSAVTGPTPPAVPVEIVGTSVVIGFDNQLGAFSLAHGKYLGWRVTQQRNDRRYRETDNCPISDLLAADDTHAYFADQCLLSETAQYGVLDVSAGRVVGDEVKPGEVPFKIEQVSLVSADPLVVLLRKDGLDGGEYRFFDRTSKLVARVPVGDKKTGLDVSDANFAMPPGDFHTRWRAVSDGKTFVTITATRPGKANKLVALDTATGKKRWSVSVSKSRIYTPIAIDGTDVIVAAGSDAGQGSLDVVHVELATGKVSSTTHAPIDKLNHNENLGVVTQFAWANGKVYGVVSAHALPTPIDGPSAFGF